MPNDGGTLDKKQNNGDIHVAVNSIQSTALVERLPVYSRRWTSGTIIPYDKDNLYPNKIKSIAQRSGTVSAAIGTLSSFVSGNGFQGMDIIVNSDGQNLWDILRFISYEKAMFKGFALHFNYNALGQVIEINPINFEFARWHSDLDKIVLSHDWAERKIERDETTYYPFNPSNALNEIIAGGGIEKYKGQILYSIPQGADLYTVCTWDAVIDDAQLEAEVKLYGLRCIQNDYSLGGIITYPTTITNDKEKKALESDLRGDKGSDAAGGIRVVGAMPMENMQNWKWFTPISRNNIDNLHKNQKEDAKFNIYACFRQPPILNGVASRGMFNESSFADAFNYYNATTETERKEVERECNKILAASVWFNAIGSVVIEPKKYVTRERPVQQPTQRMP